MKKNRIIIILFIFLFFISTGVKAENLTLEKAVFYFLNNSSQLENAEREINISEIDLKIAKKGLAPEVNLQGTYTRMGEAPQQPTEYVLKPTGTKKFNGMPVTKYQFIPVEFEKLSKNNYSTTLAINKPIYLGGQVKSSIKLNETLIDLNKLKYEKTLNDNIYNVIQSYFNVLLKESILNIRKNSLNLIDRHLETVQKNYKAGLVIKSDVNKVKIELNNTKQEIIKAENDLKIAKKRLSDLIEIDELNLVLKEPDVLEIVENLSTQLEKAYHNRFEIKSLNLNKKINEINKKMENSLYKPSFFVQGNYNFQGSEIDLSEGNFTVSVSGSIPLYDGGKSNLKQEKKDLEKEIIDNNKRQIEKSIETEIMASLYKIDENRKSLKLVKQNEQQALDKFEAAKKRYDVGVNTSIDVLKAETNLIQIQISKNQSYYQYLLSLYDLLYKTGTLNKHFEGSDQI